MPRVLIVDDDKFTRTVLETIFGQDRTFKDLGLEVYTAPDGERGLQSFRELGPEVVVVDLLMPKVDGFAVCREIRATAEGQATHLAVISGVYRDQGIAQRLRTEYDASFFAKPYQLKEMTRHVATVLAGGPRQVAQQAEFIQLVPPTAVAVSTGELAERPLPAVLLDLLEVEATGRLLVRRGKVSKTIELLLGHPVAITSSLRDETLGQLLLSAGVISDAQHRQALANSAASKQRIGEALIALGALTPEQLGMHLAGQLRHKLVTALRWPIGAWRFEPEGSGEGPARPSAPRAGAIDLHQTLLTGLRDSFNAASPPDHLRGAEGCTLELTARGQALLPAISRHIAPRFRELWRDGMAISELVGAGMERREVLAALDALLLCGGVI
ncbi:MAG TPA: response regulator, partial [Kofleriaceae bacterium]|nr:response regulator [Kofleriaceae bacterium]